MQIEKFFVAKKFWWIRHTLFWLVMYVDVLFEFFYYTEDFEGLGDIIIDVISNMVIVYLNIYVLIPKYLVKKKYTAYILLTIASALAAVLALFAFSYLTWTTEEFQDMDLPLNFLQTGFYAMGTLGVAVAIKVTRYFYERQNRLSELKQSQLSSEVTYLKQQTNPHFLFNTLNSIYVLAKQKKDNTPEAIMLLADLMRYQTYDASSEKVPLTKEIEFLENYLKLEKIRRDKLKIEINTTGHIKGELIEPLIFLPFVENAVKHSASTDDSQETINILLENTEDKLELTVINSVGKNTLNSMVKENSGFGLDNAKKRINLLYPDQHTLTVKETKGSYKVTFIINK